MSKEAYLGVDGRARKVKAVYIGVDGIARKVQKAYVGVDGKARLWWSLTSSGGTTEPGGGTTGPGSIGSFEFTWPTEPVAIDSSILTTVVQQENSEIALVFGLNAVAGSPHDSVLEMGGTLVNQNPDLYLWNFNYTTHGGFELPEDQYLVQLPYGEGELAGANGLYQSGANRIYLDPVVELGGVSWPAGQRCDVFLGFHSNLMDQIDVVRCWKEGDEFYQEGDEEYCPCLIDVRSGTLAARLAAWTEMGEALSNYLEALRNSGIDKAVRYGDPYAIALRLEQFCAGIPWYIASQIASGGLEKKTAVYVTAVDWVTLTCADPAGQEDIHAGLLAEGDNFSFLTGSFPIHELVDQGVQAVVLAPGLAWTKDDALADLMGFAEGPMPIILDLGRMLPEIGLTRRKDGGYSDSPAAVLLLPVVQAYLYMDALAGVSPALNPAGLLQYAVETFFHVKAPEAAGVALCYVGDRWNSVDEEYDRVPDVKSYDYDPEAIEAAAEAGAAYGRDRRGYLQGAYHTKDTAYRLLTQELTDSVPEGHDLIEIWGGGSTWYFDLIEWFEAAEENRYIFDYYEGGWYNYGGGLQTTLQNYWDRMIQYDAFGPQ